jgi:hypothetical protein
MTLLTELFAFVLYDYKKIIISSSLTQASPGVEYTKHCIPRWGRSLHVCAVRYYISFKLQMDTEPHTNTDVEARTEGSGRKQWHGVAFAVGYSLVIEATVLA